MANRYDVIVVGGGHAGAEAAWAAANLGASVAMVTLDPSKIGVMPCNPAIGGLAKGQIVREIDALGGLMGLAADATGIMFKVLNSSRGPAVHGPRCQCDKHAYAETVQTLLRTRDEIDIIAGSVERILVENGIVRGVTIKLRQSAKQSIHVMPELGRDGTFELCAPSVVLTTGTFMRGLMHRGADQTPGGRVDEPAAVGISAALIELGFELGRLKTGTPPRIDRSTIDWEGLEAQPGDVEPTPFSELTSEDFNPVAPSFPHLPQVECRITTTNAAIHDLIRANLHLAPMYNGQIESAGPRYCPSIEDKVVRFAQRNAHHVFLEPESHRDESIYCNGISTSLPAEVQAQMVRLMPGCQRAKILKPGYAVEYDMVRPHQIDATCMTKRIEGFFLAGQINGTSGYEEAAGQGLLAGINAVRFARRETLVTLRRDQAYIGVMMDDLVTKTPVEPYRMFTSRAEHRLSLRADNAPDRLTAIGRKLGVVDDVRWRLFTHKEKELAQLNEWIDSAKVDGERLSQVIKRPGFTVDDLARTFDGQVRRSSLLTVLANRQYAGYVDQQRAQIARQGQMEQRRIPARMDYSLVAGLRTEARHALGRFSPATFGQASRLEGVTPADLSLIMIAMKRLGNEASLVQSGHA